LKRKTARIGHTINSTKTKYMVAVRDRSKPCGVGAEVVLKWDVFAAVEEFVYLETLVTCGNRLYRF